jgi:acid phosphatase family membrane protein YuiD
MNKAITTAILSILSAQLLKIPLEYQKTGKWNLKTSVTAGGMPSSHSAAVASLASYIGFKKGFKSPEFAISAMLGLIVMYDAAGVRWYAGETAIAVNDLEESVEQLSENHPEIKPYKKREKELKERLGHLPSEVVAGAIYGSTIGAVSYFLGNKN